MKTTMMLAMILLAYATVTTHAATRNWNNDGPGTGFATDDNWVEDVAPVSSNDTVVLDSSAGTAYLNSEFTVGSGQSMTAPGGGVPLRLGSGDLTVATGGTLDFASASASLAEATGGGSLTFESGATVDLANVFSHADWTWKFIASASGVSTVECAGFWHRGGVLELDLTNYNMANGNTLVLFDYTGLNDVGVFGSTNVIGAPANGSVVYAYDQGGGDMAIAYVMDVTYTWTDDGSDHSWTTAENWNLDSVPGPADVVSIGSGYSVTNAQKEFGTLTIATNTTVVFGEDGLQAASTITCSGTLDRTGVWRLIGGGTITLTGTGRLGTGITWLDLQGADLNFQDGASFGSRFSFEHRTANTFGFKLSEAGFTPLELGQLYSGGTTWADATYTIDVSDYNPSNGTSITLMDFTGSSMGGAFDPSANSPTVNIIAGGSGLGGVLAFDTDTYDLVLTIDPPGNDAPVVQDQTISVSTNGPTDFTLVATDLEGSNLTYAVIAAPIHGSLSGTAPDLTYTVTGGVFRFDSFTFTASDGEDTSNTGTVSVAFVPNTQAELWSVYHDDICNDALNTEWLTNWTDGAISMYQIRYELGELTGSRTNAMPKIAAYYAHPTGGTALPGLLQIHGGGQRGSKALAKYWAEQGYAAISINWGGLPLENGVANTDWDGLPAGFVRDGVTDAIHHNWADPNAYSDGATLYDIAHPLNSSWILNSYAARRALTFLSSQANVDSNRLGVTGWSMGGRTTVITSTDPRITSLTPGVGGTGFLYEDWWGLPGTARSTNGVQAVALYNRTAGAESYWPHITAPLLFHEAANDYNAPFDLLTRAMALQPTNAAQRLTISPHFNHRVGTSSYAAKVLWHKAHLAGGFDFPETAQAELDLSQADGIPRFRVWPDTSTSATIQDVDIYYGIERDSRIRFWRDAEAVQKEAYWEAACPIYDTNEMFVAVGLVTYEIDFDLAMPAGYTSPTRSFYLASEVSTVYPDELAGSGVVATATQLQQIDDFSRGYHDWYALNTGNAVHWELWTRKVRDPAWRGREGAELAVEVETTVADDWLGVTLITKQWNGTDATTYHAFVPLPTAGANSVSLPVSAFTNGQGAALTTWEEANQLGLRPANKADDGYAAWSGSIPTFSNLRWEGGPYTDLQGTTLILR